MRDECAHVIVRNNVREGGTTKNNHRSFLSRSVVQKFGVIIFLIPRAPPIMYVHLLLLIIDILEQMHERNLYNFFKIHNIEQR